MVKRNDGRRRKPLKRKKTDYAKNADGVKRRRAEPKRRLKNIKLSDVDYIETE
jgi:hypothetical protein